MMDRGFFPFFIDISKKKIIMIGGGNIATRRVDVLLRFVDSITVVSPKLSESLRKKYDEGEQINWISREWQEDDLAGYDIALAATNKKDVNTRIWEVCRKKNIPINVADDKNKCDFLFPNIIKEDDLIIGISTGGADPNISKKVRKVLSEFLKNDEKLYD